MSGAVAQRRGFFSSLFMRPAKLNRQSGGGSMTLMPLVSGRCTLGREERILAGKALVERASRACYSLHRCATGVRKRVDMSKYQTLSEEQKAKIKVGGC